MSILWKSDQGNGTFKNPIIFADYSDPDVIRVGDTYYMTASSFNYVPGLPILISRDLVNWKLVNYAVPFIDEPGFERPLHAKGIWAPAIRYHDGEFYIYYGMPDEGIYMVKASNPLGKWDAPVCVLRGKGLIDSCPFWDEDGRAYLVHGYAKSRIGFKSVLGIFEMSPDGTKAVSEDHILYDGIKTQPTIEGPKVYKRDGWYYIFAPAGGVKQGWQTVLRSKSIYGPFEERIVLAQGESPINGPHQGGLVDTPSGEEWFIHFQDAGAYGRITHLQPVRWENEWPIMGINEKDGCGEPVITYKKPDSSNCEIAYLEASDDFDSPELNLMWQWTGNPRADFYSLDSCKKVLRLNAINMTGKENPILWECSNVLTQKLICPSFVAKVSMDISSLRDDTKAGFVMFGGEYTYLAVAKREGRIFLEKCLSKQEIDGTVSEDIKVVKELATDCKKITISFDLKNSHNRNVESCQPSAELSMSYLLDGSDSYEAVSEIFRPSDHTWVGAKLGLFCVSQTMDDMSDAYAQFEYIHVEEA